MYLTLRRHYNLGSRESFNLMLFFAQKMLSAYYVCSVYPDELQINFIMKANTMNPDFKSSLIWVHIVCNIGCQTTLIVIVWFEVLRPSQQLWSCQDSQFT